MKKFLLLLPCFCGHLLAQNYHTNISRENESSKLRRMATISLAVGIPQDEFRTINDHIGIGIRGNVMTAIGNFPLRIGLDYGYLVQQNLRKEFNSSSNFQNRYTINASSNIATLGFTMRFDPFAHKRSMIIQPFIDGSVGGNAFFSTTETTYYSSRYGNWSDPSSSSKTHWAFTYGGSVGIAVPVGKHARIEAKGSYYLGDRTKYLIDPIIDSFGNVEFTEKKSETTMLIPQIGLNWQW